MRRKFVFIVCSLALSLTSYSAPGSWKQIGQKGEWSHTLSATILDQMLYSVEKSGFLYVTDLTTGKWKKIGKADFAQTAFLLPGDNGFYSIERDGSLFAIQTNGIWKQIGKTGDWKGTIAAAILDNQLFSIESSGALYVTNLTDGTWKQLGKADFAATIHLVAGKNLLFSIGKDGSLYAIEKNGTWKQIGKTGDWKGTLQAAYLNGKIYTIETSGALYETNPLNGHWKQLGNPDYAQTSFLIPGNLSLFSIERDGSLYQISIQ